MKQLVMIGPTAQIKMERVQLMCIPTQPRFNVDLEKLIKLYISTRYIPCSARSSFSGDLSSDTMLNESRFRVSPTAALFSVISHNIKHLIKIIDPTMS